MSARTDPAVPAPASPRMSASGLAKARGRLGGRSSDTLAMPLAALSPSAGVCFAPACALQPSPLPPSPSGASPRSSDRCGGGGGEERSAARRCGCETHDGNLAGGATGKGAGDDTSRRVTLSPQSPHRLTHPRFSSPVKRVVVSVECFRLACRSVAALCLMLPQASLTPAPPAPTPAPPAPTSSL